MRQEQEEYDDNSVKNLVWDRATEQMDQGTDLPVELNASGLSGLPLPLVRQILYYAQPSWSRSEFAKSKRGMSLDQVFISQKNYPVVSIGHSAGLFCSFVYVCIDRVPYFY